MSSEIELGGQTYRIGTLNTFQQQHVARRVAPFLPTLIPVFLKADGVGLGDNLAGMFMSLQPFFDSYASATDETVDYITTSCLGVVSRKNGKLWTLVYSKSSESLAFDDIDLKVMMTLVFQVINQNLGSFLRGMPTSQPSETAQ